MLTDFALEGLPEDRREAFGHLLFGLFKVEPLLQAFEMQVADGARALAGDEQGVLLGGFIGVAEAALLLVLAATALDDRIDFFKLFPFFFVIYCVNGVCSMTFLLHFF